LWVKNDNNTSFRRKALIKFEIPTSFLFHECFLHLFVLRMGTDISRTITLKTLSDNNWKEDEVTWANLNTAGPGMSTTFMVNSNQVGSWLKIDVSEFISEGIVTFLLENNGTRSSQSHVLFGNKEDGIGSYLQRLGSLHSTATPTSSPSAALSEAPSKVLSQMPSSLTVSPSVMLQSQTPSMEPSNQITNFCGYTWMEASQCGSHMCRSGSSSECPIGRACYGGINSCHSHNTNFCAPPGFLWIEANKCSNACPQGLNTECPFGELCYGGIYTCTDGVPTAAPTMELYVDFDGIEDVYSFDKGELDISWDIPVYDGILEFQDEITYHIFVALETFDYELALAEISMAQLISNFLSEPSFQYHTITNALDIQLISTYYGKSHSLLVTAELNGLFSKNTATTEIIVSSSTPHVRDGIDVIGIFAPSENLDIVLGVPNSLEDPHDLLFAGPLQSDHFNLIVGDHIFGFSSEASPFIRRINEIKETSTNLLRLSVLTVPLENLFDELDLEAAVSISRRNHRDNNGRRHLSTRRRLIFGWIKRQVNKAVSWAKKTFSKVIDFIGDLPEQALKFLEGLVTGKFNQNFSIVDISKDINEELIPDLVTLTGNMSFKSKLIVQVKIGFDRLYSSVRLDARYSFGARLDFEASDSMGKEKKYDLWSGGKKRSLIAIVEVNWNPNIDLVTKVDASFDASAHFEADYFGSTSLSVTADTKAKPILSSNFKKPSLEQRTFSFDIEGVAQAKASVALVFSMQVGIYDSLLGAELGVSLGVGVEAAGGLDLIKTTPIVYIDKFGANLEIALPFSATAIWGKYTLVKTNLYEHSIPFLKLPSAEIKVAKDFNCKSGGGQNGNNAASIDLVASKKDSDAIIPNGFSDDTTWYLGDGFEGWSLINSESDTVTLTNPNVVSSSSPIPEGKVYVTLQPEIPPLLKRLYSIELRKIIDDDDGQVECLEAGTCSGDDFFDTLSSSLSPSFNSNVFLSQPPDPSADLVPSSVYKFEDLMSALNKLQNSGDQFKMWLGKILSDYLLEMDFIDVTTHSLAVFPFLTKVMDVG
jgi:hypothetical protein